MPSIPRRDQTALGSAPLPGVRAPTSAPLAAFTGDAGGGVDVSGLNKPIADFIAREREKADQLALLEADNHLAKLTTDLRTTAFSRRGKSALGASQETADAWGKSVSEIEQGLTNDRQRSAFRNRVANRWEGLYEAVERHASGESLRYDDEQTDAAIKNRINDAIANYADPQLVARAALETRALVADRGKRNGVAPEVITEQQAGAVSAVHVAVIDRMIANGEDQRAIEYFKKAKVQIGGPDTARVERALDVASTEGQGLRSAEAVWRELGPQSTNDPVKIATMESRVRDRLKDDPKVMKAAIAELRSRAQAHNAEQVEMTASRKAEVLGAFNNGTPVSNLVRSPAYLALSGTEQEQLKSYMLHRNEEAQGRYESTRTRQSFAKYWELSDPVKLAAMSDAQVLALEPELGRSHVGQLMTRKRALVKSDETVRIASMDQDQFNSLAQSAGFKPYGKLGEDDKATLGRLKNAVENEIDQAQQTKGKTLTRDEKQGVMQTVIDRKVMLDRFWGDKPALAVLVQSDDRGRAYVPRTEVPDDRWDEMRRYVLKLGGAPRTDRLQRMRAARLMDDRELYDQIAREP